MLLYKQDDPQVITNPAIITGWGGSVSGINFLPITHMCVHSCVLACMCMCKVYYQFLTWSQRSLHAWLTSIVPIMSGILIRPCLIIVNIAVLWSSDNHHHHHQWSDRYCPGRVVIKFQAAGLLLLDFTTNCVASGRWGHKSWSSIAFSAHKSWAPPEPLGAGHSAPFQGHLWNIIQSNLIEVAKKLSNLVHVILSSSSILIEEWSLSK